MSLEGKQIDRYIIARLLGSGGMGDVYLAEDPRIGQQVAIKVIRTELSPYPDEQAVHNAARLFQREAKAIVKLDHPHILPLYDYGEEHIGNAPVIYLVMPYRPEGSLTDWLRHRDTKDLLSPQDIAQLVSQAADALQHAHEHHVIHQDVKPSNFLVRARPDAPAHPDLLLSDFGIARLTTATSSVSQSIRGTPAYMAPEQWEGEPVPATDQYALAVMTYELLTGKLPFQGGPGKMMYHHINTPPQPPSSINPLISSDIDTVLMHALAKQPDQRFATIKAFANAYQQAAQSQIMHGTQTIRTSAREETAPEIVSPVVVDESEMMAPTLANSGVQNVESDSETFVKAGETLVIATSSEPLSQFERNAESRIEPPNPVERIASSASRTRSRLFVMAVLVMLVLTLIGGGIAFALPTLWSSGSITSSVTITPINRDLNNSFTVSAVKGVPYASLDQINERTISVTTSVQTQAANASGSIIAVPGVPATGTAQVFLNSAYTSYTYTAGMIFTNQYVPHIQIVLDGTVTLPPIGPGGGETSALLPIHVVQVGTIGNLPSNGFSYCQGNCSGPQGQAEWIGNWGYPFSGGKDPQTYTAVQQSDIDNAAHSLEQSNTPNPQQIIQPLVHANERLIGTPKCNPNVTSDHAAGDKAANLTVSVSFTCTGEAYDNDGALAMAAQLLTNQANTQLGSGYAPVGTIKTTLTSATLTDTKSGTITLMVDAEGVWAYQFTDAQKQALARLIAGKTKSAAQTLLASQTGIGQVVITVSGGNNSTLPTDASKITIVVNNASG